MSEPIRVLLVSNQPIYRAGLRTLLAQAPSLAVIDTIDPQGMVAAAGALEPDLVLWHAASCGGAAS